MLGLDLVATKRLRGAAEEIGRMDEDTRELIIRLCTAAGMIMEDSSPLAISRLPAARRALVLTLADLEQATRDANMLIQAAQVLARREAT